MSKYKVVLNANQVQFNKQCGVIFLNSRMLIQLLQNVARALLTLKYIT